MIQLPLAIALTASDRRAERDRHATHLRAIASTPRPARAAAPAADAIVVRMLGDADREDLARIAGRDSALVPESSALLGAEVDGRLLAALSLDDGAVVADPFRPSSAAVELLRLRARQLGGHVPKARRWPRVLRGRHPARASLAGSPPGAGGRLLEL